MNPRLPRPKSPIDLEWEWPSSKFGLPHDALFTTLHGCFNTRSCAILDPHAFHHDVSECGESSDTLAEFYKKLGERREQRVRELEKAWKEIRNILVSVPSSWDSVQVGGDDSKNDSPSDRWGAFCQLSRTMSFDSLVRLFDGFARDERELRRQEDLRIAKLEEKWHKQKKLRDEPVQASQTSQRLDTGSSLRTSPKARDDTKTAAQEASGQNDDDDTTREHSASSRLATPVSSDTREHSGSSLSSSTPSSISLHEGRVTARELPIQPTASPSPCSAKRKRSDVQDGDDRHPLQKTKRRRGDQENAKASNDKGSTSLARDGSCPASEKGEMIGTIGDPSDPSRSPAGEAVRPMPPESPKTTVYRDSSGPRYIPVAGIPKECRTQRPSTCSSFPNIG